jgi:uncharacterized protein
VSSKWIQTLEGRVFDFDADVRHFEFRPNEIATVLARIPRFNGHSKWFYSVAQHSVLVARQLDDPEHRLAALVHDVPEVFTGDLTAPMKAWLGSDPLQDLEMRLLERIAIQHGFPYRLFDEIKTEDLRALATERRDLLARPPRPWVELPPPWDCLIEPWDREYARYAWISEYARLSMGRGV